MRTILGNRSGQAAHSRLRRLLVCLSSVLLIGQVHALEDADIPTDAPADDVMAGMAEVQQVIDWAGSVFAGVRSAGVEAGVRVEVIRQDFNVLRFGESCMETPLRIGTKTFGHGLGTHANSEIVLHLPAGAKRFKAAVGIDNNFDTQGRRGSAEFVVEHGGRELFRSAVLRGGQDPVSVDVELPAETRALTLKVNTTPDGPGYDQADWAEARVEMEGGRWLWADAQRFSFLDEGLPFSFAYDGKPAEELLKSWKRTIETHEESNCVRYAVTWADDETGLQVCADVKAFKRYPAVEWLLHFENRGQSDTPIISEIHAAELRLRSGYERNPVILHQITGDVCGEQSFLPVDTTVEPGKKVEVAPVGGRSSNHAFPFFDVQYGNEGVITAIGWSGQWSAAVERLRQGPARLRAGMEKTHFRLHPGERVRSPRMLVMPWTGDRVVAHNRFRRLLQFEYVPRVNGRPLRLPVAAQCFDRYSGSRPEWGTEAGQIRAVEATSQLGCDTHWFDAAWFVGGFPHGVGNWLCKPESFPRGLKPVSDACHAKGLKFLLWFEPERVAAGTQIAREHPEYVFGGTNGGLFKLNEPAARRWLTDLLSQRITEYGVDVYRNDFNIDPLEFWRQADAPDRQGITEIRYVEGHYAMWDELRNRHPGLWIDNCASGGRRIDLETLMRSVPLWRSDTGCGPGHADWDQVQALGLGMYIPLSTSCSWEPQAYVARSAGTGGAITQYDYLGEGFPLDQARAVLDELKANQKYWYGDFYPLTQAGIGPDRIAAWQLHRSDLNAGMVLVFRRSECPYPVLQTGLRGVAPDTRYTVEFIDEHLQVRQQTMTGKELGSDFEVRLPSRGTSLVVRYRKE